MDNSPNCQPDVVVDLNKGLAPFESDSIDEIRAEHFLEHVEDLMLLLEEMYRVSKNGAVWNILVPHYSRGFLHPFHTRGFSYGSFDWFFTKASPERYGDMDLSVQKVRFNYTRLDGKIARLVAAPLNLFANINRSLCERVWCYWVGGFDEIQFTIVVHKKA